MAKFLTEEARRMYESCEGGMGRWSFENAPHGAMDTGNYRDRFLSNPECDQYGYICGYHIIIAWDQELIYFDQRERQALLNKGNFSFQNYWDALAYALRIKKITGFQIANIT